MYINHREFVLKKKLKRNKNHVLFNFHIFDKFGINAQKNVKLLLKFVLIKQVNEKKKQH